MNRFRAALPVAALVGTGIVVACSSNDATGTNAADAGAEAAVDAAPGSSSSSSGGSSSSGSLLDAYAPTGCLDTDPFVSVEPLSLVNTAGDEVGPTLPADESQLLYVASSLGSDAGSLPARDLVFAQLADGGAFAAPQTLDSTTAALDSAGTEDLDPTLAPSGDDVLFVRRTQRSDGGVDAALYLAHRSDNASAFGAPTPFVVPGVDAGAALAPFLAGAPAGGLRAFYFTLGGAVYRAAATSLTSLGAPAPVTTNGAPLAGASVVASADETALYVGIADQGHVGVELFASKGDAGVSYEDTGLDLAVNADGYDTIPRWLSPDRCRLYLVSDRPSPDPGDAGGGYDLYVAKRKPR